MRRPGQVRLIGRKNLLATALLLGTRLGVTVLAMLAKSSTIIAPLLRRSCCGVPRLAAKRRVGRRRRAFVD